MFQEQIEVNMLKSAERLLVILGKTNTSNVEVVQPGVFRHISKKGIVTIIHGYSTYQKYALSGDDGTLQRCNGFYFTLKKQ